MSPSSPGATREPTSVQDVAVTRSERLLTPAGAASAVLASPSGRAQRLADVLDAPREGEWEAARHEGDRALVVCRVSRDTDDVVALLWLLDAGVPVVLVDRPNERQGEQAFADLGATHVLHGGVLSRHRRPRSTPVHPDRRVTLPTSGSSGRRRYVALSTRSIVANATAVAARLGLASDDVGATTLAPTYSYGLSNVLAHAIAGGTVLCSDEPVTTGSFWATARAEGTTSLAFAGSSAAVVLAALRRSMVPPTLRRIMFAGGPVAAGLVPELYRESTEAGVALHLMYGQTEAGPRITISDPLTEPAARGTVGAALDGVRIRVVDAIGDELRDGEEGQIEVQSPYLMAGYVRSSADLARPRETVCWWDTGDRGRRDAGGRLWIDGRSDDVRKVSGYRVDLADVRTRAEHGFGCTAAVVATPFSLTVCLETDAAVRADDGRSTALAASVGLPLGIVQVRTVPALPRGASGKIDLGVLGELVSGATAEVGGR